MRRIVSAIVLLAVAVAAQAVPQSGPQTAASHSGAAAQPSAAPQPQRKIPCKVPENASMCYWTRGMITCCNGNPSMRMWKVGTKRILGILSGPNSWQINPEDSLNPELPVNLGRAYSAEYRRKEAAKDTDAGVHGPVFGDFEICPLEPERPGWMQPVCIESAKNIFFDDTKHGYSWQE